MTNSKNLNFSPTSLLDRYQQQVEQKIIDFDASQWSAVQNLQILLNELHTHGDKLTWLKRWQWKSSSVTAWQGLYLFGGVGRGKSMLMAWFYDACNAKKRRVHFHVFMQDLHRFIHENSVQNTLQWFAKSIRKDTQLLCFDEFHINDIADVMLFSRLFETLFAQGIIIVITSNYHPDKLYPNGVQRAALLPLIELLQSKIAIIELAGLQDYRLTQKLCLTTRYFFPLSMQIETTRYSATQGSAFFSFEQLCGSPKGARDYLALAQSINTLILTSIPQFTPEKHNEARRFITLIDVLYEYKVRLICSAEVAIDELYQGEKDKLDFERTRSRLIEMQSRRYC